MKLAIEVDSPKDANLFFPPIGQRVRGRFDAQRRTARNPDCASLLGQWPRPIPGQRIAIDTDMAELVVEEPLEDEGNSDLVALFRKRGIEIPKTKTYSGVHVPSCLTIMKRAVDANLAKVVEGKMPSKIDGDMLKSFVTPDTEDETDTLRRTVAENSTIMRDCVEAINKLADAIAKQGDWDK